MGAVLVGTVPVALAACGRFPTYLRSRGKILSIIQRALRGASKGRVGQESLRASWPSSATVGAVPEAPALATGTASGGGGGRTDQKAAAGMPRAAARSLIVSDVVAKSSQRAILRISPN